jgi:hypothetical protein
MNTDCGVNTVIPHTGARGMAGYPSIYVFVRQNGMDIILVLIGIVVAS